MSLPPLSNAAIELRAVAADWRTAVLRAGALLSAAGATTPAYGAEMVRMIEEHGPYVVISPGLALAHARPGPSVLADGLSVLTLAEPVVFGHPNNDPVCVVLGLAVHTAKRHIAMIADLANVFNDRDATRAIVDATDADAVRDILGMAIA